VNREVKSKNAVIADLKSSLPPDAENGDEFAGQVAKVESDLSTLEEDKSAQIRSAEAAAENDAHRKRNEYQAELLSVEVGRNGEVARLEREIQKVKDEAQARLDSIRETMNVELQAVEKTKGAAVQAVLEQFAPKKAELQAKLTELRGKMDSAARAAGVLRSIKSHEEQRDEAAAKSERLSSALAKLDSLKSAMMADLPIEGVEIRSGEIFVNGREFNTQLNTAEKYKLGFKIAALDKKPDQVNIVFIDNGESLDSENKAAVVEAAKELGVSLVMAEVTEDETLQVATA
jgi:hypothetical protein